MTSFTISLEYKLYFTDCKNVRPKYTKINKFIVYRINKFIHRNLIHFDIRDNVSRIYSIAHNKTKHFESII